jgi:cytochrome P450
MEVRIRGRLRHEPSYKFLAFNSGPRSCLGKDLGLNNMKLAAASIIYNFKVELVEGHAVMPESSVTLHTRNGMMVRLKRRDATA